MAALPIDQRCDHLICRVSQQRQDMGCSRRLFHDGNHLHTVMLGYCGPRFAELGPAQGHLTAHRHKFSPPSPTLWHCSCGAAQKFDGRYPVTVRAR